MSGDVKALYVYLGIVIFMLILIFTVHGNRFKQLSARVQMLEAAVCEAPTAPSRP